MNKRGSLYKRVINGKTYFYLSKFVKGKTRQSVISESEAYNLAFSMYFEGESIDDFYLYHFKSDISYGVTLYNLCQETRSYKKRYCFQDVQEYLTEKNTGKVLILYGLRRTGKTTLMLQTIRELPLKEFAKAVYIKCRNGDTIYDLFDDLKYLERNGFKYFFIDEVTLLEDFVALSSTLSDIYGMIGKVVLSGTDSLGFNIAAHHELFDRYKMIHTTYISYKEFSDVLGIDSIDQYIEYGGTLNKEGINYNRVVFSDNTYINEYIDSSIVHNIIHSLKCYKDGKYFLNLFKLYEKGELANVINRIVEDTNHAFAVSVIEREFKSDDYGSLKQLLSLPNNYEQFGDILSGVGEEKLTKDLMDALSIINKEKQTIKVDDAVLLEVNEYLKQVDVLSQVREIHSPAYTESFRYVFTQPGLRYSQAKELVKILLNNEHLKQYDVRILKALEEKMLSDVKGKMIEDIVLLETSQTSENVFKFIHLSMGEYDMVCYDPNTHTSIVYEVKHSSIKDKNQVRFLFDETLRKNYEKKYGSIVSRNVIYQGENAKEFDVNYLNVSEFLKKL